MVSGVKMLDNNRACCMVIKLCVALLKREARIRMPRHAFVRLAPPVECIGIEKYNKKKMGTVLF